MTSTTPAQSFPYPGGGDTPDIPRDIQNLALAVERRVMGVYNNAADRDSKVTSPQEGQVAYLKDTNAFWYHTGSAWAAMFDATIPAFTAGTTAPSGGIDGDVYFRYS